MFINRYFRSNLQESFMHLANKNYSDWWNGYGNPQMSFAIHTTPLPVKSHFEGKNRYDAYLPDDRVPSVQPNKTDPASYRTDGDQTDLLSPLDLRCENTLCMMELHYPKMTPIVDDVTTINWNTYSQNWTRQSGTSNTGVDAYDVLIDPNYFNNGNPLLGRYAGETYTWFSINFYGATTDQNHSYAYSYRNNFWEYNQPYGWRETSGNKVRTYNPHGWIHGVTIWGTVSDRNGDGDLKLNSIVSDTVNPVVITDPIKIRFPNVL